MPTATPTAIDQCAVGVDSRLFASLVRQESNFNPYAIGLDGKAVLKAQPRSYEEAARTADNLVREGKGFSVGLGQIHVSNVARYGLTWQQAFDPCTNLRVASVILRSFHIQAMKAGYSPDNAVFAALRGYNSGSVHNPVSNGYARDILGRIGYGDVIVPRLEGLPAPVTVSEGHAPQQVAQQSGPEQAEEDPSTPSMFSTPSPSMFGESRAAQRPSQSRPQPVAQVAVSPATDEDGPVLLRATAN